VLGKLLSNWSGTARKLVFGFGALVLICAASSYLTLAGLSRIRAALDQMRGEEEGVRLALELASAVRDQYAHQAHAVFTAMPYREAVDQVRERFSREYLVALMREFKGNVSKAAERARVERETLHRLLKKHGVGGHNFRDGD
jgi:DNA-binding NtrC family response regulator